MHSQKVVVMKIEPVYVSDGNGGLRPVCESDPCFTVTICSYGDGGGVSGSQREIENKWIR